MKRIICLLLSTLLVLGTLSAALAAGKYDSEPEKLLRQFLKGSGIKGTITLNTTGGAEWAQKLSPLNGQVFQLRALDKDEEGVGFHYRLYLDGEEGMHGMSEFVGNGTAAVFTSDFLPGQAYSMPASNELISALLALPGGNASWYGLLANIAMIRSSEWTNDWEPQLAAFNTALERWLAPWLVTEVTIQEGETLVLSRYTIPASEVKAEMLTMLETLMSNQALLSLIAAQTGSQQVALYLQPGYLLWYQQLIEEMPMTGDIVLERLMDAQGNEKSWLMDFQVGSNRQDLREVVLQHEDDETVINAIYADQTIYLTVVDSDPLYTGTLRIIRDQGDCLSIDYTLLLRHKTSVDKENRNHDDYEVRFTAESDLSHLDPLDPSRARYVNFGSLVATFTAGLYSKSSDTTPVTGNAELNVTIDGSTLQAVVSLKSMSPWHLPELPDEPWTDLSAMSSAEREEVLISWFDSCLQQLGILTPVPVEDDATPTDMEE